MYQTINCPKRIVIQFRTLCQIYKSNSFIINSFSHPCLFLWTQIYAYRWCIRVKQFEYSARPARIFSYPKPFLSYSVWTCLVQNDICYSAQSSNLAGNKPTVLKVNKILEMGEKINNGKIISINSSRAEVSLWILTTLLTKTKLLINKNSLRL